MHLPVIPISPERSFVRTLSLAFATVVALIAVMADLLHEGSFLGDDPAEGLALRSALHYAGPVNQLAFQLL